MFDSAPFGDWAGMASRLSVLRGVPFLNEETRAFYFPCSNEITIQMAIALCCGTTDARSMNMNKSVMDVV
jgi:hypothetical protein